MSFIQGFLNAILLRFGTYTNVLYIEVVLNLGVSFYCNTVHKEIKFSYSTFLVKYFGLNPPLVYCMYVQSLCDTHTCEAYELIICINTTPGFWSFTKTKKTMYTVHGNEKVIIVDFS